MGSAGLDRIGLGLNGLGWVRVGNLRRSFVLSFRVPNILPDVEVRVVQLDRAPLSELSWNYAARF